MAMEVTLTIDEGTVHAVAGVIDQIASERRTASGAIARGKGDHYTYKESFREELYGIAKQLREAASAAGR